jgi:hypothetical protein
LVADAGALAGLGLRALAAFRCCNPDLTLEFQQQQLSLEMDLP